MPHTAKAATLEKQLRPGSFLHWQGQRYRLLPGDACDPLTIRMEDIATSESRAVRIEELLLPKDGLAEPIFAPTLEALQAELERRYPPPPPVNVNGLPDQLVRQADSIVADVEMVERLVAAEAGRAALGRNGHSENPSGLLRLQPQLITRLIRLPRCWKWPQRDAGSAE
jgi:hypothetical protein